MFETIFNKLTPDCEPWVLEHTIQLAVELAREGREGHKIGTMFVVGDEEAALKQSKPLILDPLQGHPPEVKKVDDSNMRETAIFKRTFRRRDGLGSEYLRNNRIITKTVKFQPIKNSASTFLITPIRKTITLHSQQKPDR